jgi:aspartyl-tRNA(Asn)/glutamyl-tRNA(Gln) amidotransferase subunit C
MAPYSIRRMARVTIETVAQVARLARLELSAEERATFARQLDEILAYAETLQALDTAGVEPMSHAGETSALREDAETPGLARERAQQDAPDVADGLFRVPRVLGG